MKTEACQTATAKVRAALALTVGVVARAQLAIVRNYKTSKSIKR